MRKWKLKLDDLGFELSDCMPHLNELQCAAGMLLFARSAMGVRKFLGSLVAELSEVRPPLGVDEATLAGSARQCRAKMLGLHVNCVIYFFRCARFGKKWMDLQFPSPPSGNSAFGMKILEDQRFPFLSVFSILLLLFHRLRAFKEGIVPYTTNTYKVWTFTFVNSADPSWGTRRTWIGHLILHT